MKMKKNKAGKLQYYDSKGRYSKTPINFLSSQPIRLSKAEEKRRKKEAADRALREKAVLANRKNPYLLMVFDAINSQMPNEVLDVECDMNSKYTKVVRNLDILTKNFIIEIKSGKAKGKDRQLFAQLLYGEKVKKKALVFAPNIDSNSEERYRKKGIIVFKTVHDLLKFMKEKIK